MPAGPDAHPSGRREVTNLDIGRTGSSEPSSYGSVPEGFMLLYFAVIVLFILTYLLSQRACPGGGNSRSS